MKSGFTAALLAITLTLGCGGVAVAQEAGTNQAEALDQAAITKTANLRAKEAFDKKDYETALSIWKPLAENGNSYAQSILGNMYLLGLGVKKQETEAARFWLLAANQKDMTAQRNLGFLYEVGVGVNFNFTKARDYYELSAAQGSEEAKKSLKELNTKLGMLNGALDSLKNNNFATAVTQFRILADQKFAAAQLALGRFYCLGIPGMPDKKEFDEQSAAAKALGVNYDPLKPNREECLRLLKLAAGRHYPLADLELASYYESSDRTRSNIEQVFFWYYKAAKDNDPKAQKKLGDIYALDRDEGFPVTRDVQKALEYYRLSAAQGNADANYTLGQMYEKGQGVPNDLKEAVRLYQLASGQGSAEAKERLGKTADDADKKAKTFELLNGLMSSASTTSGREIDEIPSKQNNTKDLSISKVIIIGAENRRVSLIQLQTKKDEIIIKSISINKGKCFAPFIKLPKTLTYGAAVRLIVTDGTMLGTGQCSVLDMKVTTDVGIVSASW